MRDYASLFSCLSADLGLDEFVGPPGPVEFAKQQLLESFYKKLAPDGTNPDADKAALEKFKTVNSRVKQVFDAPPPERMELVNTFEFILERASSVYQDDLCLDLEFLQRHIGVGPGMNVKASGTGFYQKLFDSALSVYNLDLLPLFRGAVAGSDTWADAERQRFERFGFVTVAGSTLFFVPKNREISRTAATEATVEMLIQKGIGSFLEQCLWRHFRISLATQPDRNREMARLGSLNGHHCTVDLVSASDMVGSALCDRFLSRSGLNAWLKRCRSRFTVLPDGTKLELNMVSTMGNGFTFPLQTLIFACVVKAAYSIEGLPFDSEKLTYGVFGDDIVCLKKAYESVVWLLSWLGFEVNAAKSFSSGPFRESCGYDYYQGRQVRGVYVKTLESLSSVYSALNRLNRWQATHRLMLPRTVAWLRNLLPKRPHYVPFSAGDHEGYKVPQRCLDEVYRAQNGVVKYKALVPRTKRIAVPIDRQGSDAIGYSDFNESGWGVTFLGGYAQTVWPTQHLIDTGSRREALTTDPPLAFMGLRDESEDVDLLQPCKSKARTIPWWDLFTWTDGRFQPASYQGWQALLVLQTLGPVGE